MEEAIFTELIKYGGGVAVLIALYFVLKEISQIVQSRNGNGKLGELQKIVTNDYRHEFDRLWDAVDKINDRLDETERRLIKLEVERKV